VKQWLRRLFTWPDQDRAWKATGYRLTTEAGYDQDKAVAAHYRAQRHTATGRPIGSTISRDKVQPFRRAGR
jgi:hypothetical protein